MTVKYGVAVALRRRLTAGQAVQVMPQLRQYKCTRLRFRDNPTNNSDAPAVSNAAVAFPPETPSLSRLPRAATWPRNWQCGHTICASWAARVCW